MPSSEKTNAEIGENKGREVTIKVPPGNEPTILRVRLLLNTDNTTPTTHSSETWRISKNIKGKIEFITLCSIVQIRTLRNEIKEAQAKGVSSIELPTWIYNLMEENNLNDPFGDGIWRLIEQTVVLTALQRKLNNLYDGRTFSESSVKEFITKWRNSNMYKTIDALFQDIFKASQDYDLNWSLLTERSIPLSAILGWHDNNCDWGNFCNRIIRLNLERIYNEYLNDTHCDHRNIENLEEAVSSARNNGYNVSTLTKEAFDRLKKRVKERKRKKSTWS